MSEILHLTSGDRAGVLLEEAGVPGEVFVWHDVLYDGPREPGWPDEGILRARSGFLEGMTGGGLPREKIYETLVRQYGELEKVAEFQRPLVLWFDACLFDQSMLAHLLSCLAERDAEGVELLCIDGFPGIEPYNGLGQLKAGDLLSVYDRRQPVDADEYAFAEEVDSALATQDADALAAIADLKEAPLRWMPAAIRRWLQEQPDPFTGLGRLESLALGAVQKGISEPGAIFREVQSRDTPPQYWGDITLWAKINGLAEREPALVRIEGPADRLPQWESDHELNAFQVFPMENGQLEN